MSYPVRSHEDFLSFVQTHDPDQPYHYWSPTFCACAAYCRSRGIEYDSKMTLAGLEALACNDDHNWSWTYGALADRIKAAIALRHAETV